MPTCAEIISLALRQARVIGVGKTAKASEAEAGLEVLQGMYEAWATGGMFGRLNDVLTSSDYEAQEGDRIRVTDSATVTIPEEYDDYANGGTRAPYDLSLIEIVDVDAGTLQRHLFDRTDWVRIDALASTDEAPLATRGRDGLSACLAESFAEQFGGEIGPGVARRARDFRWALASRYGTNRRASGPDYF